MGDRDKMHKERAALPAHVMVCVFCGEVVVQNGILTPYIVWVTGCALRCPRCFHSDLQPEASARVHPKSR